MCAATQLHPNYTAFDLCQMQRQDHKLLGLFNLVDGKPADIDPTYYDTEFRHYEQLLQQGRIHAQKGFLNTLLEPPEPLLAL